MAQMFQMDLPVSALVALVVTALGASIGTPAVSGVGIVVLATVLSSAGVPLPGLAMIIGLDQVAAAGTEPPGRTRGYRHRVVDGPGAMLEPGP